MVQPGEVTLVGERGPELATYPPGTLISPSRGVGGITININVAGSLLGTDVEEFVEDALTEIERRSGISLRQS